MWMTVGERRLAISLANTAVKQRAKVTRFPG